MFIKCNLLLLLVFLSTASVNGQKVSDRQKDELIGPVKIVRIEVHLFDFIDGAFEQSPFAQPDVWIRIYRRDGRLKRAYNEGRFHDREIGGIGFSYDLRGNVIEERIDYSSKSRYVHSYDAEGKRITTDYYEEEELINSWTYEYERYDEIGNWTKRVVTPVKPKRGVFLRRVEYREITYE